MMKIKPETSAQITICDWVKKCTNLPFIHVPNEGKRGIVYGSILKKMGLMPGVADIFIPRAAKGKHGLWLELKATQANKLSENQKLFLQLMREEGYEAVVCYGAEAAIAYIASFYGY